MGGLAIIAGHKEIEFGQTLRDNEGRVMSVETKIHNQKFHIVNLHAPNTGGGTHSSPQTIFFDNLDPFLQTNNPLIIGGDFNFVENPKVMLGYRVSIHFGPLSLRCQGH